jgi:cleavage stimulation factor subunit 3
LLSLLLNFSYAELCESRKQLDDARQAFDSLVESLDKDIENLKQVSQQEIANLHQEAEEERASLNLSDDIDGELREQLRSREKHVKKEQEEIEARLNEQVEVIARASSLVWINYMRFARRTDVSTALYLQEKKG